MQTSQIRKLYLLINLLVIGQTLVNAVTITAETLKSYGYNNESERVNLYIENVTNIDADAFNGYTKLTTLYLASLTEFDFKVLRDSQNLSYLSLSNNHRLNNLTNSENLVFEELETLVLTNTSISTLSESVIKAFPNLSSFYGFSLSNLSPLTDNQLSPWSKLTSLQLTTNNQSQLTARMFTGLQSIQSIYFWSSNISVIDSDTFSNLSSLQTLDLMNNSIKSVNHLVFPKSLVFLRCASNSLSSLNFSQGPLPIHALDLGHNRFETFRSINFSQLVNLTMLILNSNPIRNPNEVWDQIKEARDLFSLSLNQIGIEVINSSIFQPFKRLQILSLKSNLIETIGEGSFALLSNLTTLSLINNSLTRLEPNAFSGVGDLKHLILNMNNISSISRGTFSKLEKLESLMLSDNKLRSIDSETFSGLTKLKSLSLNNNKIENVDLRAFNNLTSLQRINLDGNEITDLDKSTFSGCINLVVISVKRNPKLRRLENMQELCPNPKCQVLYD